MRITPNLGPAARVVCGVAGVALIAAPFVSPVEGWWRVILPLAGVVGLVQAALGY